MLPATIKVVGKDAFSGCKSLKRVVFAEGLLKIGRYAFSGCAIESVEFPSSLEEIQERAFFDNPLHHVAFSGDSKLKRVDDCAFGRENGGADQLKHGDIAFPAGAKVTPAAFEHSYFQSSFMQ